MNVKQLSNQFNKSQEEIAAACKEIFGEIPTDCNDDRVKELAKFFSSDKPKLLGAPKKPGSLAPNNTKISKKTDELTINQQEIQAELDQKIVESAKLNGIYKARAAKQIEYDAFVKTAINEDIDFYNKIVNGSLAGAIKSGSIANNASEINNFQIAEVIDTQAVLLEAKQRREALPPSPEELMQLLPPSNEEMLRLLDEM